MRGGRPAFFGDWPVPAAIRRAADASGARLHALGHHYDFTPSRPLWAWRGQSQSCAGLPWPPGGTLAQLRNASLVLAVLEQHAPTLFADPAILAGIVAGARQPGRFQVAQREQEWVLDVAHNAQAAATLREQLGTLPEPAATTVVIGMLGDKPLEAFAAALGPLADRWLACSVRDPRARSAASIAAQLRELGCRSVTDYEDAEAALVAAAHLTPPGGRIVVTGSFRVVGPALVWLGLY
jgi:dihydrofolate synthase/folylpolyglutamate synthase